MKKGEIVINITSIKVDGVFVLPGSTFEIGKDMKGKDANRFLENDAIKRHFPDNDNEEGMTIEEMSKIEDLKSLNVKELKAICKHLSLTPYSSKNEAELIEMIEAFRNDDVDLDELNLDELLAFAKEEGIELPNDADEEEIREIIETEISR